jgi:hypothetical protein
MTVKGGKDHRGKKLPLKHTALYIVEKVDGVKQTRMVETPKITFRITKKEHVSKYLSPPPLFVPIDHTYEVTRPHHTLLRDLADFLDEKDFFQQCIDSGRFSMAKQLHLDPVLHGTDVDICDHTIGKYINKYKAELDMNTPLTKGFWDIEVDSSNIPGFPVATEAPSPINLIGFYDQAENTLFQFVLRNPKNPLIAEFEADVDSYIEEVRVRYADRCPDIECEVFFFDDELKLIKMFFKTLNDRCRPDVLCAWNLAYDGQTTIERIKTLGGLPEQVMCPQHFEHKQVYYYEDQRAKDISEKKDQMQITSDVIFLDQMIQYAVIRKSMAKKDSYALDAVLADELKMQKDDVVEDIKKFPYLNFRKFMHYNGMDVMGCFFIEKKTGDTDLIYQLSLMTQTRMTKSMTKTTCLRNMAELFFKEQGYILSNNRNQDYSGDRWEKNTDEEEKDEAKKKFRGAFVANPCLVDRTGIPILGVRSNRIFEKTCDLDLAALYPSIIQGFNIDSLTQVGKAFVTDQENDVFLFEGKKLKLENKLNDTIPKLVDSLQAKDFISTGRNWYGLPSLEELAAELNL